MQQRLVCASEVLEDDSLTIGHYAKAGCASVELELYTDESTNEFTNGSTNESTKEPDAENKTVSHKETMFEFQVKTTTGTNVTLRGKPCITIRAMKARLKETRGIDFDDHILRFSGRELEDSATLGESGVQDASVLHMIKMDKPVHETDVAKINVTLPNNGALVIDNIATSASVGKLKLQICSMKNIKPEEHRLVYHGCHLAGETSYSLAHFGIRGNSDVQLRPNVKKADALEAYLMMSADERENAVEPIKALRKKARSEGASDFCTYKFVKQPDILHESQRAILCELLGFMWHDTAIDGAIRTDVLLPVSSDPLVAVSLF